MNELINMLLNQDSDFLVYKNNYQTYAIVLALSKTDHTISQKAQSLLKRASLKEPMNFDLEAEHMFMEVLISYS